LVKWQCFANYHNSDVGLHSALIVSYLPAIQK